MTPGRIRHDHNLVAQDGVGAESHFPRRFRGFKAAPRLEPLALFVEQRDQADRHLEDLCGKLGQVIERPFRLRIEQPVALQRLQALFFIGRELCGTHAGNPPGDRPRKGDACARR